MSVYTVYMFLRMYKKLHTCVPKEDFCIHIKDDVSIVLCV